MDNWENKKSDILRTAARLFIVQGYDNTGMRQIAEESDVSLGLINYHFGSKKNLGILLIQDHLKALRYYVGQYTKNDERLFMATVLRLNYIIFNSPKLRCFYEDTLKNDIYLEALSNTHIEKSMQRSISIDKKYELLCDSYVPVNIERAMVLCPFTDLLDIDVPDLIFKYFMYGFINSEPSRPSEWYLKRSKNLVDKILEDHPHLFNIFENIPQLNENTYN